jgi:hypothetical protein
MNTLPVFASEQTHPSVLQVLGILKLRQPEYGQPTMVMVKRRNEKTHKDTDGAFCHGRLL